MTPRDLKFYNKFQMSVKEDHYPIRRVKNDYRLNPFQYSVSDQMAYTASAYLQTEEVETVLIRMPKDQLEHLQHLLEHYEQNEYKIKAQGDIIANIRNEERIRMANPSVKKAYDKYRMLLDIVRYD